jgi:hypothetical protein
VLGIFTVIYVVHRSIHERTKNRKRNKNQALLSKEEIYQQGASISVPDDIRDWEDEEAQEEPREPHREDAGGSFEVLQETQERQENDYKYGGGAKKSQASTRRQFASEGQSPTGWAGGSSLQDQAPADGFSGGDNLAPPTVSDDGDLDEALHCKDEIDGDDLARDGHGSFSFTHSFSFREELPSLDFNQANYTAGFTTLCVFCYSTLVQSTLDLLNCTEINEVRYLSAAAEQVCMAPWQWALIAYLILVLATVPALSELFRRHLQRTQLYHQEVKAAESRSSRRRTAFSAHSDTEFGSANSDGSGTGALHSRSSCRVLMPDDHYPRWADTLSRFLFGEPTNCRLSPANITAFCDVVQAFCDEKRHPYWMMVSVHDSNVPLALVLSVYSPSLLCALLLSLQVTMYRRLVTITVHTFLRNYPFLRWFGLNTCCAAILVSQVHCKPFRQRLDNFFEFISLSALMFISLLSTTSEASEAYADHTNGKSEAFQRKVQGVYRKSEAVLLLFCTITFCGYILYRIVLQQLASRAHRRLRTRPSRVSRVTGGTTAEPLLPSN